MASMLEARDICRRHPDGRGWLLENVSVKIPPGGRLAVGGASGSGKTLLARALALLDPLYGGEIRWRDRLVRHESVPSFRRDVAYLHQKPALMGATVEASLLRPFELKVHRDRRFERGRLVDWLGELGRDKAFLEKRVADLSGGECQIAALLRAIQLDPALLLLDEPTAALDTPAALGVEKLLERWFLEAPGNRAWLWIGHDEEQIGRVADRWFWMEGGRLTEKR
jgi:putative ABC transport system ATP-binding protein